MGAEQTTATFLNEWHGWCSLAVRVKRGISCLSVLFLCLRSPVWIPNRTIRGFVCFVIDFPSGTLSLAFSSRLKEERSVAEQLSDLQLSVARGSMFCLTRGEGGGGNLCFVFLVSVLLLYCYMFVQLHAACNGGRGGRFLSLSSFSLPPTHPPCISVFTAYMQFRYVCTVTPFFG